MTMTLAGESRMTRRARRSREEIEAELVAKQERRQERALRALERQRETSERAAMSLQAELAGEAQRAAEREWQQAGIDYVEGNDTEGARWFAAEVARRRSAVKSSQRTNHAVSAAPMRAVRKAEIEAREIALRKLGRQEIEGPVEDVGSGQTLLKFRRTPIARLIDIGKLGPEEIQAAQEIESAFFAIDSRGRISGMSLDRVDGGGRHSDLPWSARVAGAVQNYQRYAVYWTKRSNLYADPMLQVVIAAVIDERPVREIAMDVGRRHSTVELGLVWGLRDYSLRAGFATAQTGWEWVREDRRFHGVEPYDAAERVFVQGNSKLADAMRRARVEV